MNFAIPIYTLCTRPRVITLEEQKKVPEKPYAGSFFLFDSQLKIVTPYRSFHPDAVPTCAAVTLRNLCPWLTLTPSLLAVPLPACAVRTARQT